MLSLEEANAKLSTIFENIAKDQAKWEASQDQALKPAEAAMDKCIHEKCWTLHKNAQRHFKTIGSGVSTWQRSFTAADFEKHYLPRIDLNILLEMEKAQICVA